MSLTRDFKETIRARVERDPKFRKELLREGIESMLIGDIATAKTILRVGFTELAEATQIPSKSLMRMMKIQRRAWRSVSLGQRSHKKLYLFASFFRFAAQ